MSSISLETLDFVFAVVAARADGPSEGPFPAAQDIIFGTAFAITDQLFLTAGHVVTNAASVGVPCLGRLAVGKELYERIEDFELFKGIDVGLVKCPGLAPQVLNVEFSRLAIFEEVKTVGFALGLDPQFHSYAPRGFAGHIVAGRQRFTHGDQPLIYELSFVPPKGMSGAPLMKAERPSVAGVVLGWEEVEIEDSSTKLGIAVTAEEFLRLESRLTGEPLSRLFGKEQLAPRARIKPVAERHADSETEPQS